jgi:hypothetical protein
MVSRQQQAQQAWAQTMAQNHATAATLGMQRALGDNPLQSTSSINDMQQVQETAFLRNSKAFMLTHDVESENHEDCEHNSDLPAP